MHRDQRVLEADRNNTRSASHSNEKTGSVAVSGKVPRNSPLFRTEVLEFQQYNRQWGRVVPLQPLSIRIMTWFAMIAAAGIIAFLFYAQYARKEIAIGYLEPSSGTAKIFASRQGTIAAVYVAQGETVKQGQPLLLVQTSETSGTGEDVNAVILSTLRQQKDQLTRQIEEDTRRSASERQRLMAQLQEHQTVLQQLAAQMTVERERIGIMQKIVESGAQLRGKGLVSETDQRHREESLLAQQETLITLIQQSTQRQGQLSEVRFNLEQLAFKAGDELQALRNQLSTVDQRIAEVNGKLAYVVRSPVNGAVSLLEATPGALADPRHLQMEILPAGDALEAKIYVPMRAIGFIAPGQTVRIMYDAFPYQQYGIYTGRVLRVSKTVLQETDASGPVRPKEPAYTATVGLDKNYVTGRGRAIPLQPDMSLRASIVLEQHTLAEWIVSPLRYLKGAG
jgi:membrane fusion protein